MVGEGVVVDGEGVVVDGEGVVVDGEGVVVDGEGVVVDGEGVVVDGEGVVGVVESSSFCSFNTKIKAKINPIITIGVIITRNINNGFV